MKYAPIIAIITIAAVLHQLGIPGIRLPFAAETETPTLQLGGITQNACPDVGVPHHQGSPFRIDYYDGCEINGSINHAAVATNTVFWLTIIGVVIYKKGVESPKEKTKPSPESKSKT